jgi:6-phosphogluconolactonase
LGMGEDGHTASLFPGSGALNEKTKWVVATKPEGSRQVATRPEGSRQDRITLTAPVFNQAARVMFLVTGAGKAERLAEVLHPQPGSDPLPAQRIQPLDGKLEWLVDKAAASLL